MLYKFLACICPIYFKTFHRLKVNGIEHVPQSGSVVFCPNHIHNLDPPAVAAAIYPKRQIAFMAKAELFENKWISLLLHKVNAFPVERGESDIQALKQAMGLLRNGQALGIFPEGTRSRDGELSVGSSGATMLALKNNAIVIPVAISGRYKLFKPLSIHIGEPVNLDRYRKEKISANDAKEAVDLVMNEIQVLLTK